MLEMNNVGGELEAAIWVFNYCIKNGIKEITLYHDYIGIAHWYDGSWQANKDGTKLYVDICNKVKKDLKVNFIHVRGHSNDRYNDEADELAGEAINPFVDYSGKPKIKKFMDNVKK